MRNDTPEEHDHTGDFLVHVVDDTKTFLVGIRQSLQKAGLAFGAEQRRVKVETFSSPMEWIVRFQALAPGASPDLCLFDISMHGDDAAGTRLARLAKETDPLIVVVMYSQFDDADTVLELMDAGADSFVSKRTPLQALPRELSQAYSVALRKRPIPIPLVDSRLQGKCVGAMMESIAGRVPSILNSAVRAVHVEGETGTGKEMVADLIELALQGAGKSIPFVRVNCGALSPTLLESELFGHRKGAFTGAASDREGLLESANGGWVFLDEVACLSTAAQISLLRVIENQEVLRVGDTRPRKVNIRVLSACNDPLERRVSDGTFRRDLWQRLTETNLQLPPLRERKEEIEPLARFFCAGLEGGPYEPSATALELLKKNEWREGNIRQLRNCLRAMTEFSDSKLLGPNSIPLDVFAAISRARSGGEGEHTGTPRVAKAVEVAGSRKPETAAEGGLDAHTALRTAQPPEGSDSIALPFAGHDLASLERLLFAAFMRRTFASEGPNAHWSLRVLATRSGLSRMTITRRLADALATGAIGERDLPAKLRPNRKTRKRSRGEKRESRAT